MSGIPRPRVLLVGHEPPDVKVRPWSEGIVIHRALSQRLSLDVHTVDACWPDSATQLGDLRRYEAVIWFTKFRKLRLRPPFDWKGYDGLRLMYDMDACQDFTRLAGGKYVGQWAEVFRRHRFDVLVCTGQRTRDHLRGQGVDAEWIPKAADGETFHDHGLDRQGLCTFGFPYSSRQLVMKHLRRRGVVVDWLSEPPVELNRGLNRYLAAVICNAELRMPAKLAMTLSFLSDGRFQVLAEGPEPMIKNFEVAASGTAPICDELPELRDLGFVDGSTAVLYRSLTELSEKLRYLLAEPDQLRAIGRNAAALVRERHTWDARAAEFASLIAHRLKA